MISEIIHDQIDQHLGGTNKNLGDSFFVVWKFPNNMEEFNIVYDENGFEKVDRILKKPVGTENQITYTAELALLSFINI